jgi:hypothetical protein
MPNWCSNTLTITHSDAAQIERAVKAFRKGSLMNEFYPDPSGEWNYDWSVNNWGTKWDVGGENCGDPDVSDDGKTVYFNFDSAWAPPLLFYEKLEEQGFDVQAMYYEPGIAFAGIYSDGYDDYYEFANMRSDEVADVLPGDLNDYFGISETMAEYEDDEPLTEWYTQGVEDKGLNK